MFQVRRTFLLIVTFDVIFMVLLWIIYNQVRATHSSVRWTNSSFDDLDQKYPYRQSIHR